MTNTTKVKVNFYNRDATKIERTREYTLAKAWAAIRRSRQIAEFAGVRTERDQSTCHH